MLRVISNRYSFEKSRGAPVGEGGAPVGAHTLWKPYTILAVHYVGVVLFYVFYSKIDEINHAPPLLPLATSAAIAKFRAAVCQRCMTAATVSTSWTARTAQSDEVAPLVFPFPSPFSLSLCH